MAARQRLLGSDCRSLVWTSDDHACWTGGLLLRTEDSNNDFLYIAQNSMEFWYYDSNNQKEKCTRVCYSWKAANMLHSCVEIQLHFRHIL